MYNNGGVLQPYLILTYYYGDPIPIGTRFTGSYDGITIDTIITSQVNTSTYTFNYTSALRIEDVLLMYGVALTLSFTPPLIPLNSVISVKNSGLIYTLNKPISPNLSNVLVSFYNPVTTIQQPIPSYSDTAITSGVGTVSGTSLILVDLNPNVGVGQITNSRCLYMYYTQ